MPASKKIAVAGATGRVGRHVVDVLEAAGHDVVRISRTDGIDLISGDGLDAALAGVECIVDAATGPSSDEDEATAFFTTAARNLQESGARAGVQRVVVVSIIGADKFSTGYNAAKVVHEHAHLAGPLPTTILRAAQFHEFVGQLMDWTTQGDTSYLPELRTQLVAARTVAEALAELAIDRPSNGTILEIAGPREERLAAMAALLAAQQGGTVTVEEVHAPDPDGALFESGALLPGPDATLAGPTFEAWVART